MKIYRLIRVDIETGEILEEHSFDYRGPLALCGPGDGEETGGGGEGPDFSGLGDPDAGGAGTGLGGGLGGEHEAGYEGGGSTSGGEHGVAGFGGRAGGAGTGLEGGFGGQHEAGYGDAPGGGQIDWGNFLQNFFTGFALTGAFTLNPGIGVLGGLAAAAGVEASEGNLGDFAGGGQAPDTSDTGGATEGGDGGSVGGFGGESEPGGGGEGEPDPGGLLDPGVTDDEEELDEDEETLGRGRRATQTLLTGGRGLLSPARTRRRTLLAA